MSHSYNTDKRRTTNRGGVGEDWDYAFSGERYGNQRRQQAELKVRDRRIQRAKDRKDTQAILRAEYN